MTPKINKINQNTIVSVIIPVYNVGKYIEKCIRSLFNQDHPSIQIIAINDGSKDDSPVILDQLAKEDNRLLVVHKDNGGVSSARNCGIDRAKGEYIVFVDSDDYVAEDYISYLLSLLKDNDASIAYTDNVYTDKKPHQIKKDHIELISGEEAAERQILETYYIGCYSKIFDAQLLMRNNIRFFTNVYIGEGLNFNTLAYQYAQKVVVGHRKVYYYRTDNMNSAMTKFSIDKCQMAIRAIDVEEEHLVLRTERLLKAISFDRWNVHRYMLYWIINSEADKEFSSIYDEYYKYVKKYAYRAFGVPCSFHAKIHAVACMISPRLIPIILKIRKKYSC